MPKQRARRANGEGSFYQTPDNMWVCQITLGRKPDGSLQRKAFKGKTRAACMDKRDAYIKDMAYREAQAQEETARAAALHAEMQKRGHSVESETLFSEAFLHWLKLFKAPPTKKATTYSGYLNTFEVHFDEFFGAMMLHEITRDVVQQYYNLKQLNGSRKDGKPGALSAKTIRNHHMILRDFFDYASERYKLPSNPAVKTERPEVARKQLRVLDPDEMVVFLREVMRETQRTTILFALFMGLRVGELLAAEVDDIDIKTQSAVFALLAKHLYFLQQSGWPNPHNLLFPSTTGTYIDPGSFQFRLDAVSKRCEIKKVNPHALRHTFATRLVEEDVPLTTVQRLLGHASVSTTERYVTTMPAEMRNAMESVAVYCDPLQMLEVRKLNGTKDRMSFANVLLPTWLQTEPSSTRK